MQMMRRSLRTIGAAAVVAGAYVRWVRPRELTWGATKEEVALRAPGAELVRDPNQVATRAVTGEAPPEGVWPWLVQIGTGRAGWYSYDRLDNKGRLSAREIVPAFQQIEVGDVVAMSESKEGEPFGPSVLALDPPRSMLWGDLEEPHRFTWLWLLREHGEGQTRLISRVRCRLTWRDPLIALLMEFADPIMMRKSMLNIAERAEATDARGESRAQAAGAR